MEEQPVVQSPQEEPAAMPFSDKLMNIVSSPGTLFDHVVKTGKTSSNWSIPLIFLVIVSIIFTLVVFTQPPIKEQMKEQQLKAMEKRVEEGKMTREEYDRALEFMPEPGAPMWLIFGAVGVSLVMVLTLFISALVFWLVGKYLFKVPVTYGKVSEVVGLSMYIMAIGSIVSMIFIIAGGSLYSGPSLAMALPNFDPVNKLHKFLLSFNLLTFWYLGVLAVGIGKLFNTTYMKSLITVAVLWLLYEGLTTLIGLGM
jgi:hypothetical protein